MDKVNDGSDAAYSLLESGAADGHAICNAIIRLGKPYDEGRIRRAGPLVASYLGHMDALVRYQAIWFLGCWGRLPEYLEAIIGAAKEDGDLDNRAYAARCMGRILKKHASARAVSFLLGVVNDPSEESEVRLGAYSALVFALKSGNARAEASDFEPVGNKTLADIDLAWLKLLESRIGRP